ncbi:P-loop containing nucleoside triphosphate hydrolase protein [Chaetomidium leptoderma]|uniref:P-loop containing nucleoside triphosphate hydrolase protein n=1 Tax=Chaetomidium leptoderma TaxID=669021 RepID=A0AAN6VQL6_9PEZI|nr:P-loop containing nucleoside triphosphate hydrolase protein [Chaetomidium leptoderma]
MPGTRTQNQQRGQQPDSDKMVVIAVMGVTGAGKSTFIETVTGREAGVGDSLASATSTINAFELIHKNTRYVLIDTPGFNDTERPDTEITTLILDWLTSSFADTTTSPPQQLNGVLYLHRITDPRMSGTALRNTRMFRKLVGHDGFPHVLLATTCWERVPAAVGLAREAELRRNRDFWGAMVDRGATMARLPNRGDRAAALRLLERMGTRGEFVPEAVDEVVVQGKTVGETVAAVAAGEGEHAQAEEVLRKQLEAEKRAAEARLHEEMVGRERERQAQLDREREAAELQRRQQLGDECRRQEEEARREEERHKREREELQREIERQEERRRLQAAELERQRKEEEERRRNEEAEIRRRFREEYRCIGYGAEGACAKCNGNIWDHSEYFREFNPPTLLFHVVSLSRYY